VGTVIGSVLGALGVGGVALVAQATGWIVVAPRNILLLAAGAGGALGAVLAPTGAWILMRHVPIWRAVAEPGIGTLLGALVGIGLMGVTRLELWAPAVFGIVGFAVATARLRLSHRSRAPVRANRDDQADA
jgi:hypothetical protein